MNRKLMLLLAAALLWCAAPSWGAPLDLNLPYQKSLTAAPPVIGATTPVTFTIYDSSTLGNTVWSETKNMNLLSTTRLISTTLGSVNPLVPANFADKQLWVEVKVGAVALVPRDKFNPAPYALWTPQAGMLDSLSATDGQVLTYNGGTSQWKPAAAAVTSVTINSPLSSTGTASAPIIGLPNATTSQTGALSNTDWNTFNGKENALTFSSPLSRSTNTISLGTVPVANGGTGAATAAAARTSLGVAASGANSDISSLTGLTTALSLAQGGTGSATGSITGSGALTMTAGGTNQNVTLTPSGSGYTLLNGNVGIGTATPNNKLHIGSTTYSVNSLAMGNGTQNFAIDISARTIPTFFSDNNFSFMASGGGNGNVGIGTTAPGAKLEIKGTGSYQASYTPYPATNAVVFSNVMSDDLYHSILQLVSSRQSLEAGNGANGYLGFSTIDNSNGEGIVDAGRIAIVNESGSSRNSPTALSFWTNAGTGGLYSNPATEKMRITSDGNVGIGTTSPDTKLKVVTNVANYTAVLSNTLNSTGSMGLLISNGSNSTSGATMVGFYRPDGTMLGSIGQSGATSVAYNTTSDYRLKNNIVDTHFGINDLMKIPVRDYTYKADAANTPTTGFIAQELYEIFPNAVTKPADAEDMWSVDYGKVTPLLVKGMQDLKAENDSQKAEIDGLKAELTAIKKALGL